MHMKSYHICIHMKFHTYVYTCENSVANCCFLLHISRHMTLELSYMYMYKISYIYILYVATFSYMLIFERIFNLP